MTPDEQRGAPRQKGEQGQKRPAAGPSPSTVAGFGVQFVVALLLFLYLGQWVDRKLGTEPLFLIVGVFVGAAASFYSMYRGMTARQRRDRGDKERVGK